MQMDTHMGPSPQASFSQTPRSSGTSQSSVSWTADTESSKYAPESGYAPLRSASGRVRAAGSGRARGRGSGPPARRMGAAGAAGRRRATPTATPAHAATVHATATRDTRRARSGTRGGRAACEPREPRGALRPAGLVAGRAHPPTPRPHPDCDSRDPPAAPAPAPRESAGRPARAGHVAISHIVGPDGIYLIGSSYVRMN
jgi:hypothetical protein